MITAGGTTVCVPAPPRHPLLGRDARQGERLPARIRTAVTRGDPAVAEAPLVGSGACKKQPRSCDLSRGIRTDDATGTIVFHLRRPERGFLSVLIRRVSDTARHAGPEYGDASGRLDRAVHDRELRAGTGAHARPQSLLRRVGESRSPGRVPRRDRVQTDRPARRHGHRTRAGRRRILSSAPDGGREGACGARARYPSQVHVHPARAMVFLFLNTTHPPFDDVRVRQAVNYAIDRGAISGSYGGPGSPSRPASPACQAPWPSSATAPTLPPRARRANGRRLTWRLRAASSPPPGTRGMKVTIWTYPGFWEQAAEEAVRALEKLGYRASIRRAESHDAYGAKSRTRRRWGCRQE